MCRLKRFVLWLLILACASALATSQVTAAERRARAYLPAVQRQPPSYAAQVITLVNRERRSRGIPALTAHPCLTAAAQGHTVDMATTGNISHTGSDGSSAGDRIREAGYQPSTWGECIAAGYPTPADVVAGWMNSSGHREILLSRSYVHIGVGYVRLDGPGPTHYWTVNVASPS
jgi:uncharacterized protein YkwD